MAYTLTYSYNSTSQSYSVTGYSDITTTDNVVIPSTYDDGTNGEHPVTKIGSSAFENCSDLTSVTIPDSVTFIGWKAFKSCSGLTSVAIPDSVTSIDTYAFSDCIGLTSVIIGNGVTSIGRYAFQNCSGLTSVTIPDSVTSIGGWAFGRCSGLTSVTIPDSVTGIGDYAFYTCSSLTSVNIPDGVTYIGDNAFDGCSKLTSITIPDGVTKIGDSTFYNCSSLMSVTIGNGVTSIGSYAFNYCSKLTSIIIPNSVTSIGKAAFNNCYGLTSITIPDGVTSIGEFAFSNCSRLTSVNIPDGVTSIGDNTFYGCSKLTSVIIPNSVTSIGNQAFWGCHGLTSVTIGNGVTSIGYEAFLSCIGLTSVTIPNGVTSIGSYTFSNCKSLTSVTIPDKVTSIGYQAFSNCKSLTSVTIGNSVTSIGNNTFYDCESLTSVTIGNSVTSIGGYAFSGCSSLKQLILFPSTPPTLGSSAIPTSILKIYVQQSSKTAYQAATNWTTFASKIVSDNIYLSFARFNQKNKEYIEKKINNLNASLAKADSSLQKPTTTLAKESFVKVGIDGTQKFDDTVYATADSAKILEAKLNENTIKDPSKTYLVWQNQRFPDSNQATFKAPAGCTIDWGDGTVETFETASTELTTHTYTDGITCHLISLSNYKNIATDSFKMCRGLRQLIIGYSVKSIGYEAFSGSSLVSGVVIVDSAVTSIEQGAFKGCAITSIVIGDNVTGIGGSAFYDCDNLENVVIGQRVKYIGTNAFTSCDKLKSIIIPNGVTSIANWSLRTVKTVKMLSTTPPTLGDSLQVDVFGTPLEKIIVPKSAINAYKTAAGWSQYADKIVYEVDSSDLGNVEVDNRTITKTTNDEIQAVALTNGTDLLTYAEILQATTIERL